MRNNRLSDDDIAALLAGTAPHGRPDLERLATLVDDLRFSSSESSPRPSVAVTALLDLDRVPGISTAAPGGLAQRSDRMPVPALAAPAPRRGIASMFISWFTGLGLAAKIAIGAAAAAAGVLGAGAAHALPPGIQSHFDDVVQTVAPATAEDDDSTDDDTVVDDTTTTDDTATDGTTTTDDSTDDDSSTVDDSLEVDDSGTDGVGDDDGTADQGKTEHAQAVTDAAHDDSTVGRDHGQAVSEAAHQNRGHGSVNSGSSDDDSVDDSTDDDSVDEVEDESGDDNGTDDEDDDNGGSSNSGSGNSGSGSSNSGKGKNS